MRGKGACRAALRLNDTIAGLLAEQHHRAAGTTDGWRMIREDHRRTGIVRGIDQALGDRRRSSMEMHDARACLAQDGAKAFRSDLVRNAVSEFEPAAPIGCEAVHRQAVIHIFARLNTRRRDSRQISARRKTLRQSTDIHFCAAACVGEESVGNVQNGRCLQNSFDGCQVQSRDATSR